MKFKSLCHSTLIQDTNEEAQFPREELYSNPFNSVIDQVKLYVTLKIYNTVNEKWCIQCTQEEVATLGMEEVNPLFYEVS